MTDIAILTRSGKNILLYRGKTETASLSSTLYLPATQFKISLDTTTPTESDTDIAIIVPIDYGTVCDDGDNTMTGSNGADNSTDNTTIYKEGSNTTDDTAQNLIANNTSATKTWTISDLSSNGSYADETQYIALWLYIADATTLAKFKSSGTCLEIRVGSDTSNYYSITKTAADLAVGWNWITEDDTILGDLTATGTPTGNMDTFQIIITTNNTTDTFAAGDVVYDILRQWEATDTVRDFVSGFPTFDYTNSEATTRCLLTVVDANGFNIPKVGCFNEDSSPLLESEVLFTPDSKSSTDEFAYIFVDRII